MYSTKANSETWCPMYSLSLPWIWGKADVLSHGYLQHVQSARRSTGYLGILVTLSSAFLI